MAVVYLECPCCGEEGAVSDADGLFYDGQPLVCGCPGWMCVDEDGWAMDFANGRRASPKPACAAADKATVR